MTCDCGRPLGHAGRHREYPTKAARELARLTRRRARGLCYACPNRSEHFTYCTACRVKRAARDRRRAA